MQVKADSLPVMLDLLVEHVARGERERPTLEYLFKVASEDLGKKEPRHIGEADLALHVWGSVAKADAARSLISRLRKDLVEFFSKHSVGRKQKIKVTIGSREYALRFDLNNPPEMAQDRVREFWSPYFLSDHPTRLYYPEPLFFQDSHKTKFHNPEVSAADLKRFSYLGIKETLSHNFSFVSSGSVRAMFSLFDCFYGKNSIIASALRPTVKALPEADEDIIVIGTRSSLPLITTLEASLPLKSDAETLLKECGGGEEGEATVSKKQSPSGAQMHWGLCTRRPHRFRGRSLTIFSGTHDHAVAATISYMTRQVDLKDLAYRFRPENFFPDYLQVLFRVNINDPDSEPSIDGIVLKRADKLSI